MKNTAAIRRPNYAACRHKAFLRSVWSFLPNSAGVRYHLEKLLDAALAAATTVAVVVCLIFVFTVF
jgi:hypothetical protein